MPQNNVLPDWRATYPNDAPVQKPGGVTVSTTATAPRVPNKFVYASGSIQTVSPLDLLKTKVADAVREAVEEKEEDEEEEDEPTTRGGRGRRR
jgi:hypothetical protein